VTSLCLGIQERLAKFLEARRRSICRHPSNEHAAVRWIIAAESLGSNLRSKHLRGTEMKTLLLAGATLALLTAANLSPAMAQAQTHSGGNSASADKMAPHYEYQYQYRYRYGHNAHWEGQWVLVPVPQTYGPHLNGVGTSEYGAGISE
jgi:hypothetical protein